MLDSQTLRRHEFNESFTWTDHTGPRRLLSAEQVREFDRDGFVVLRDAVTPDQLERLTAEIDPLEAALEQFIRDEAGGKIFIARSDEITFTTHLVSQSQYVRDFVALPLFCDLAHDIVGPDVRFYWDQAVYKKPGTESPFPWHQDNGYTFLDPQPYLTCWIALTDATVDNGCPWVVPGVHKMGTLHHELSDIGFVCLDDPKDAVPVEVTAGSIVVFSTLTPHCTGGNSTDAVRKSYITQYALEGAETIQRADNGAIVRSRADHPLRQFPILVDGERVEPAPLAT